MKVAIAAFPGEAAEHDKAVHDRRGI